MKNVSYSWLRSVCKMSGVCVVVGASLCSSVAMGGARAPNPSPARSWELPKSEEIKLGGGVGGNGSSLPNNIFLKYVF